MGITASLAVLSVAGLQPVVLCCAEPFLDALGLCHLPGHMLVP